MLWSGLEEQGPLFPDDDNQTILCDGGDCGEERLYLNLGDNQLKGNKRLWGKKTEYTI